MSVNKVILIGRLGQSPEIRYTAGGAPVANFSVATNETWLDKSGQKQERTDGTASLFGERLQRLVISTSAKAARYRSKGESKHVSGRIKTDKLSILLKSKLKRYSSSVRVQQAIALMPLLERTLSTQALNIQVGVQEWGRVLRHPVKTMALHSKAWLLLSHLRLCQWSHPLLKTIFHFRLNKPL